MAKRINEPENQPLIEILELILLESTYQEMMKPKLTPERYKKCVEHRLLFPKDWDLFKDFAKKKEILLNAINTQQDIKDFYYISPEETTKKIL